MSESVGNFRRIAEKISERIKAATERMRSLLESCASERGNRLPGLSPQRWIWKIFSIQAIMDISDVMKEKNINLLMDI
jgi:hypothetical protein